MLIWSSNCLITEELTGAGTFAIPDTNIYFPIITLSTQDAKLLRKLKSTCKEPPRGIYINNMYQENGKTNI